MLLFKVADRLTKSSHEGFLPKKKNIRPGWLKIVTGPQGKEETGHPGEAGTCPLHPEYQREQKSETFFGVKTMTLPFFGPPLLRKVQCHYATLLWIHFYGPKDHFIVPLHS